MALKRNETIVSSLGDNGSVRGSPNGNFTNGTIGSQINEWHHWLTNGINSMLDHPITVVLSVFYTLKNNGLKLYNFMSIQTKEEHIGHIKKSKSDRFHDR